MKVIITFTFCCDNLWKSKFVALEKPGKLWEFFSPTLWPPCMDILYKSLLSVLTYHLTNVHVANSTKLDCQVVLGMLV